MGMVDVLMICPQDSIGDSPEGLEGFSVARVAGRPRASVGACYGALWVWGTKTPSPSMNGAWVVGRSAGRHNESQKRPNGCCNKRTQA